MSTNCKGWEVDLSVLEAVKWRLVDLALVAGSPKRVVLDDLPRKLSVAVAESYEDGRLHLDLLDRPKLQ